jgi:hypothetical protein
MNNSKLFTQLKQQSRFSTRVVPNREKTAIQKDRKLSDWLVIFSRAGVSSRFSAASDFHGINTLAAIHETVLRRNPVGLRRAFIYGVPRKEKEAI